MWQVTATKDDASFVDDLLDDIVQHEAAALPAHDQHIGSIETHWHQVEPKLAYVACNPESGTLKDRLLAEAIVIQQLEPFGFKRAMVPMRWDHRNPKYADWQDVEDKAKRMVQEGRVRLNRNGNNIIQGQVLGDGTDNDGQQDWHTVELHRDDPSSQALTGSHCDCAYGQFQNTPRTRIWKQYQDRPCSHIIAAYWQSLATPIDEDQADQMTMPGMGGPMQAPQGMGLMQQAPMQALQQNPNVSPGGMGGGMAMPPAPDAEGTAPPPEDILPPFPMANQPEVQPTSIPGGRPGPTPGDPLQYPGGTFSHVSGYMQWKEGRIAVEQQYQNGDLVQLRYSDKGTWQGRSEEHGAGEQVPIPAGSVGEVLGTDPSTGMVNALFMGKFSEQNAELEPFGATVWSWPSELIPRPDMKHPGPAIRRRGNSPEAIDYLYGTVDKSANIAPWRKQRSTIVALDIAS